MSDARRSCSLAARRDGRAPTSRRRCVTVARASVDAATRADHRHALPLHGRGRRADRRRDRASRSRPSGSATSTSSTSASTPPARRATGAIVVRRWFTLVGWSPGDHLLTSPAGPLPAAAASELREAPADDVARHDREPARDARPTPTDIRDIKAARADAGRLAAATTCSAAALAALALARLRSSTGCSTDRGARARRRRRAPAHEVALAALDAAARAAALAAAGRVQGVLLGALGDRARATSSSASAARARDDHRGVPAGDARATAASPRAAPRAAGRVPRRVRPGEVRAPRADASPTASAPASGRARFVEETAPRGRPEAACVRLR